MKLNTNISVENVITVVVLVASMTLAFGFMKADVSSIKKELESKLDNREYKADRNLTGKAKSKSQDNSEAAKSVNTRASRSKPQAENTSGQIRESDVDQMSSQEYENNEKEIMEAIKTGKFIYDVSGSAR